MTMSSSGSALWGDPPANANDKAILIGMTGAKSGKYKIPPKIPLAPGSPESQASQAIVGLSIAIALVVLITGGRLAARALYRGQRFGVDDIVIVPAALLVIAFYAATLSAINYAGAGKHANYVTYAQTQLFHEIGEICQILFFAAVNLIKISMLLFIRRVTALSSRGWKIFNDVFLSVLVAWFLITLFINIFSCSPIISYYTYSARAQYPDYKCLDQIKITVAFSAIHSITDFILFCVPIYIMLKVRMPLGRKTRLVVVFALGAVCVSASIVRATIAQDGHNPDYSWRTVQDVSWTIVDITFSAVVVSLPALNAVFEDAFTKMTNSNMWTTLRGSETAIKSPFNSGKTQASDGTKSNELPSPSTGHPGNREYEKKDDEFV